MGIKGFSKGGDDFVSKFLRATVHDSTGLDAVTPKPGNTGLTCLLYTSPSPRDATLSRMPSSA